MCLGAGLVQRDGWEPWVTKYILCLSENGSEGREVKRRVQPSSGAPWTLFKEGTSPKSPGPVCAGPALRGNEEMTPGQVVPMCISFPLHSQLEQKDLTV